MTQSCCKPFWNPLVKRVLWSLLSQLHIFIVCACKIPDLFCVTAWTNIYSFLNTTRAQFWCWMSRDTSWFNLTFSGEERIAHMQMTHSRYQRWNIHICYWFLVNFSAVNIPCKIYTLIRWHTFNRWHHTNVRRVLCKYWLQHTQLHTLLVYTYKIHPTRTDSQISRHTFLVHSNNVFQDPSTKKLSDMLGM